MFKEIGLDIKQAKRMVEVCEREFMGFSLGDKPLTLMRCHSFGLPQGWNSEIKPTTCGHKGENFFFPCLKALLFFYYSSFHGMMHADLTMGGSGDVYK